MNVSRLPAIGEIQSELPRSEGGDGSASAAFTDSLQSAIGEVNTLQHSSETLQSAYAAGAPVELHDVLIRLEEAEVAFKTLMEVRNKLISAYQEVMRMGGGG